MLGLRAVVQAGEYSEQEAAWQAVQHIAEPVGARAAAPASTDTEHTAGDLRAVAEAAGPWAR